MCFIAAAGKVINREADVSFWRLADMPNAPLNVAWRGKAEIGQTRRKIRL